MVLEIFPKYFKKIRSYISRLCIRIQNLYFYSTNLTIMICDRFNLYRNQLGIEEKCI